MREEINLPDEFGEVRVRRLPSPGIAAVLAVLVPGLGHVYLVPGDDLCVLGHPGSGLSAACHQYLVGLPRRRGGWRVASWRTGRIEKNP